MRNFQNGSTYFVAQIRPSDARARSSVVVDTNLKINRCVKSACSQIIGVRKATIFEDPKRDALGLPPPDPPPVLDPSTTPDCVLSGFSVNKGQIDIIQ